MTYPGPAHAIAWLRRTFARDDRGYLLPTELDLAARNPEDPLDLSIWLKCEEVVTATGLRTEPRELWEGHWEKAHVINNATLQCGNCGYQAPSYSWPASSAGEGETGGPRCPQCYGVAVGAVATERSE